MPFSCLDCYKSNKFHFNLKSIHFQLKTALSEAQKNASLLAEYHDLYELQRKRLETSVHLLTEERELWSNAAYSLALKVCIGGGVDGNR